MPESNMVDPNDVLDSAVRLVQDFPECAPLVAELIRTFIEVLNGLREDFAIVGKPPLV